MSMIYRLDKDPLLLEQYQVASTFYASTSLKENTYDFRRAGALFVEGLQILAAPAWRPDCVRSDALTVDWALPPTLSPRAPIITGNCAATPMLSADCWPRQ